METRWWAVIRDVAIVWVLTMMGGFVIGVTAAINGAQQPPMAAIALSNVLFATVAFVISGCLTRTDRFQHLLVVAFVVWVTNSVNILFGVSVAQWIGGILPTVLFAMLGGAISLVLAPPPRATTPDNPFQPTPTDEDPPGDSYD